MGLRLPSFLFLSGRTLFETWLTFLIRILDIFQVQTSQHINMKLYVGTLNMITITFNSISIIPIVSHLHLKAIINNYFFIIIYNDLEIQVHINKSAVSNHYGEL